MADKKDDKDPVEEPVELEGGGLATTDPAFAGGAMETKTQPYPPTQEPDKK